MSTMTVGETFDVLDPVLVSDLPPVRPTVPFLARLRAEVSRRRMERQFERALRTAGHDEQHDLLTLARRS